MSVYIIGKMYVAVLVARFKECLSLATANGTGDVSLG